MSDSPNPSPQSPPPLMHVPRAYETDDAPDPAIQLAISLHRESLLRHRLGLDTPPGGKKTRSGSSQTP